MRRIRRGPAPECLRPPAMLDCATTVPESIVPRAETDMKIPSLLLHAATGVVLSLIAFAAAAADYPAPKEVDWIARDFRFHTGEVMPELRLHYRTLGDPSGEPALLLHGTGGSGA